MKTGDDTFDDIYISKKTGKVVGVMYEDVDYKLVPFNDQEAPLMSYQEAAKRADEYMHGFPTICINGKELELLNRSYGREDEK
ncbi:hypothetical protein LrhR19_01990 [Lacticaseibacillus rhamnosus]|uniref:hypothetical protein n=1 Tax=Lacticaseibacillus rhamnosus TaxID=47715 RepID=UPI0007DB4ABC|nr:hypothetical protein [Lacticaseibacillus rhamnosus]OAK78499.1 hypothetical protein LrhR19_01990 [Lacticaseibacillus rhamnosus]